MKVEVVSLPVLLQPRHVLDRSVVVFDVLRATTTMTAALAAGIAEIRIFGSPDEVRMARREHPHALTCGEVHCVAPPDFDLGNSPGQFEEFHAGKTLLMSTTNGTRAILAAKGAARMYAGAVVNAAEVARQLALAKLDVTLLCAGTGGEIAEEDLVGAGAVIDALERNHPIDLENDAARIALKLFEEFNKPDSSKLADTTGAANIRSAQLHADIEFAERLDRFDLVGEVLSNPLRVVLA